MSPPSHNYQDGHSPLGSPNYPLPEYIKSHTRQLSAVCKDILDMSNVMTKISPIIAHKCWGNGIMNELFETTDEVDDNVITHKYLDNLIDHNVGDVQSQQECCICYNELQKVNVTTTPCGHSFCFRCIIKCLERNNTCPYCREVLQDAPVEEEWEEEEEEDDLQLRIEEEDNYSGWGDEFPFDIVSPRPFWNNTSNPTTTLISVDKIHQELLKNNITFKDFISMTMMRYDNTNDYKRLLDVQEEYNALVKSKDDEKRREWDERQDFMNEDDRRHNRTSVVTMTMDRIGDCPSIDKQVDPNYN